MKKMEKIRKSSAVLAAAVLLASAVLPGCGDGTKGETKKSGDDKKQITVHVGNEYQEFLNDIKGEFEKKSGIAVEVVERETQDTLDTIQLDGAAGKGPDITLIPYDRIGQFASQGTIAEVRLPEDGSFRIPICSR